MSSGTTKYEIMGGYRRGRRSTSTVRKNALRKKREIGGCSDNERFDDQEWDIRPDGETAVHGSMH